MIGRFVSYMSIIVAVIAVARYRYRILNVLLSQRWLRRFVVTQTMRWPSVRNRFMTQMFQSEALK